MKAPIAHLLAGLTIVSAVLVAPTIVSAAINENCVRRTGSLTEAEEPVIASEAVRESICNLPGGIIGRLVCTIAHTLLDFLDLTGTLELNDSAVPAALEKARNLALSGKEATAGEDDSLTGSIAKMLPPQYREKDVTGKEISPIEALTRAEGVLTNGVVVLNNGSPTAPVRGDIDPTQTNVYRLMKGENAAPNVSGYFADIVPVLDRFSFLQRALVPNAGDAPVLPDTSKDCSLSSGKGSAAVIALSDPSRDVAWDAHKNPSTEDQETLAAYGDLVVSSRVGFVKDLWEKLAGKSDQPGGSGVFSVLLPPGEEFKVSDAKESGMETTYTPRNLISQILSGITGKDTNIPIAYLGNVKGALDCIIDGLTAHPASAHKLACQQALETPFGPVSCTDEAVPLDFPNTASNGIARRAWEIVNRLYQGFWCYWNWSKDDYPQLFDENAYRRDPNPPYPLPPGHSGNLFWCTELVRRTYNNLSLSTNSEEMARQFAGVSTDMKVPWNYASGGRFISINNATWQNIRPGYVVFFVVPGPTDYRLNHVGIVYSVSRDGLMVVQSNAATKSLLIPVNDNGRISSTVGNFRVMGFGQP